jgi:hypothetical protein
LSLFNPTALQAVDMPHARLPKPMFHLRLSTAALNSKEASSVPAVNPSSWIFNQL